MSSRSLPLVAIPLLVLTAWRPAAAAGADWSCEQLQDQRFHVRCETEVGPESPAAVGTAAAAVDTDTGLPPWTAHGDGESVLWIPLHSPPSDPDRVLVLLRSLLCGGRPACRIHYGTQVARRGP